MVSKCFDKKSRGSNEFKSVNNEINENEQLAKQLHKQITKKSERTKVYSKYHLKTIFGVLI